MRKITAAAAAAVLVSLAACEKEPETLVVDPAGVNQSADAAAETNRTTITPIELGNGFEAGNEAGFRREQTTVVGNEADLPGNGAR